MPLTLTTSRELSERLKKAGVPQKSHFFWAIDGELMSPTDNFNQYISCSAYLAEELGEMLPEVITEGSYDYYLTTQKVGKWEVGYTNSFASKEIMHKTFEADNLTEAMGLLLEHLLLNGIINV